MLKTIKIGSSVLAQGIVVRELGNDKVTIRAGGKTLTGMTVS